MFPLGMVALPTESVPLHIFEDRYRRMIEECMASEGEFGIVWLSEEELKPVGCACEVDRVLERKEDGRLNIIARGTRPFRLVERQDDLPYPAAVVEFLPEQEEEPDPEVVAETRGLYAELVEQATDKRLDDEELAELDAYTMAATVEFGTDVKQELLELRSEQRRLEMVAELLDGVRAVLIATRELGERAKKNGSRL